MKPSRHLQGLVSITTSWTVSLCAVTVATSESTRWVFCVQISAPYLYRCFLCLLEPIPSPYIVYSCPVQLQVGSLQPLKAGSANLEMGRGFICPSLRTESWRVCEGQSEPSARELRGNWPVHVELSGCLLTRNTSSSITLKTQKFLLQQSHEEMVLQWKRLLLLPDPLAGLGQLVPLIIFPQDVLHQSRTGQKSSPWRWGRKEGKIEFY